MVVGILRAVILVGDVVDGIVRDDVDVVFYVDDGP